MERSTCQLHESSCLWPPWRSWYRKAETFGVLCWALRFPIGSYTPPWTHLEQQVYSHWFMCPRVMRRRKSTFVWSYAIHMLLHGYANEGYWAWAQSNTSNIYVFLSWTWGNFLSGTFFFGSFVYWSITLLWSPYQYRSLTHRPSWSCLLCTR